MDQLPPSYESVAEGKVVTTPLWVPTEPETPRTPSASPWADAVPREAGGINAEPAAAPVNTYGSRFTRYEANDDPLLLYRRRGCLPACSAAPLVTLFFVFANLFLLFLSSRTTSVGGLLIGLLIPLLVMPCVIAGFAVLCSHCFHDRSQAMLSLTLMSFASLLFLVPSAAVGCTFLPMLRDVNNNAAHYHGPVLANDNAIAGRQNYYNFEPSPTVMSNWQGIATNRYRTKSGYRTDVYYAAPMLDHNPQVTKTRADLGVWACACERAGGCRNFPAISVSGGQYQRAFGYVSTGVRIRSKRELGFCQTAAYNSLNLMVTPQSGNVTVFPPVNAGAVFIELGSFSSLSYRLSLIVWLVTFFLQLAPALIINVGACVSLCLER